MLVFRGIKALARGSLGLVTVLPVATLVLGVFVDRGPGGEARLSFFPMALLALDPFVWTCAQNSVIFAGLVTATALIVGVGLGCLASRLGFWGRAVLRGTLASLLAASPMVLALGLVGIWGAPHPWPWPLQSGVASDAGVSLETWRGLPLWWLWIWSSLPSAIALVMLATASAVERLEPAWEDAARLAGAGSIPIWRNLIWPMIRPTVARAAALVFPLALLEPGAPLILGLRRTLAFQIVEAAGRTRSVSAVGGLGGVGRIGGADRKGSDPEMGRAVASRPYPDRAGPRPRSSTTAPGRRTPRGRRHAGARRNGGPGLVPRPRAVPPGPGRRNEPRNIPGHAGSLLPATLESTRRSAGASARLPFAKPGCPHCRRAPDSCLARPAETA